MATDKEMRERRRRGEAPIIISVSSYRSPRGLTSPNVEVGAGLPRQLINGPAAWNEGNGGMRAARRRDRRNTPSAGARVVRAERRKERKVCDR